VIAYKFLRSDGRGVFSGFAWPMPADGRPGPWVEGPVDPCRSGIHACRLRDLPHWLAHELWEIELDPEPVSVARTKVVAARGRLLRRIAAWDERARADYAQMCTERARARIAENPRLAEWSSVIAPSLAEGPALMGFVAARVREEHVGADGYRAEREHQWRWLADRLELGWGEADGAITRPA